MTFTTQQIKSAYKNLTGEVKDLIGSNETTEFISTNLLDMGLSGEPADLADSEILYAMYGLQSLDTAINNIAKIGSRNTEELAELKTKLQFRIFSKIKFDKPIEESNVKKFTERVIITRDNKKEVSKQLDKMVTENRRAQTPDLGQPPVLTQPQMIPKNLPMIEPGETAHEVPHQEPTPSVTAPIVPAPAVAPASVAIKDLKPVKPAAAPTPKYSYPGGADPYREPLN